MKRDLIKLNLESSFLSCEKDTETILRKLFITSQPHSNILKKLLVINTKDCLDSDRYDEIIKTYDLARLIEEGYIRITPKIKLGEHEEAKSMLALSFHNFSPTTNPQFRDCAVAITIICPTDMSELGDYRLRPIKLAGYIDGILNNTKLSGIGTLQFAGANPLGNLSEDWFGYTLVYEATHGSDDLIPPAE